MPLAGLSLITLALLTASLASHVSELILTQGALYGIGAAFVYNTFIFYLDEWFIERKGLAFGILWAGTGISGTIMPVLMDWALNEYGFRATLRGWAVAMVRLQLSHSASYAPSRLQRGAKVRSECRLENKEPHVLGGAWSRTLTSTHSLFPGLPSPCNLYCRCFLRPRCS